MTFVVESLAEQWKQAFLVLQPFMYYILEQAAATYAFTRIAYLPESGGVDKIFENLNSFM
jgi:hypothetical protein